MNPPHLYLGREKHDELVTHPYASPCLADFSSLPPLLFQAGGGEVLRDEIVLTAQRASSAGVDVELDVFMASFHVFQGQFASVRALISPHVGSSSLHPCFVKLILFSESHSLHQDRSISRCDPLSSHVDFAPSTTYRSRFQQGRQSAQNRIHRPNYILSLPRSHAHSARRKSLQPSVRLHRRARHTSTDRFTRMRASSRSKSRRGERGRGERGWRASGRGDENLDACEEGAEGEIIDLWLFGSLVCLRYCAVLSIVALYIASLYTRVSDR